MKRWVPQPEELFVFRELYGSRPRKAVVILVPGAEEPTHVEISGEAYVLDEDATLLARGTVRIDREKKL